MLTSYTSIGSFIDSCAIIVYLPAYFITGELLYLQADLLFLLFLLS